MEDKSKKIIEKRMNQFDAKANGWDIEPIHWNRSKAIAERILDYLPENQTIHALEYGAGTGILSFMLSERLSKITLMDSSSEMVKVINEKIENAGVSHLEAFQYDLEKEEYTLKTFDLIYTQMVMHHMQYPEQIYSDFYKLLNPDGVLAVADLFLEDGSFHGEMKNVHPGFDPEAIKQQLLEIGFIDSSIQPCFVMKKSSNGSLREYPVFLIFARK